MTDLLIRNLDPAAHRELKRRAELAGESLQAYVARLLTAYAGRLRRSDWFAQLDEVEPIGHITGSGAVAAARDELP